MQSLTLPALLEGRDLTRDQARELMGRIMTGTLPPVLLAGHLVALRSKGESVEELVGFAEAMRGHAVPIPAKRRDLLDTCGTGGDSSGTFNISTAAALLAAAMGIGVAKHGNRAVSSRSGSADVLEALGVHIDLSPVQIAGLIDSLGIGFLFAPALHPAMRHALPVRRELGVRTVFNVLGPLTNPAGVDRQLLGVYHPALCEPVCRALRELGCRKAFVVHGQGGMDEVSPSGTTKVAALQDGLVRVFEFEPRDAGLDPVPAAAVAGGSAPGNARLIREIFAGGRRDAAVAVLLNAGFAAVAADAAADVREGVELARRALDSGAALGLLEDLCAASAALALAAGAAKEGA